MQTCHPHIEGLRAIAILAIVLCHADVPLFRGGFVGVDIFFVLSGYLITGLLAGEIDQTGRVNFLNFYTRRLRRLLPALALMLLASCLVASVILPAHLQPAEAETAGYALLWFSNIHFASANLNYFDPPGVNLFLHTWSLGVAAQFYLAWPLLLLFFMRSKPSLRTWLVTVFAVSLAVSVTLSVVDPAWGFYSMHSRVWQFALGGIVFVLATGSKNGSRKKAVYSTLGFIGLLLIGISILLVNDNMKYPGVTALVPSFGAALILVSGTTHSPVVTFLSSAPLQQIGRISYSWYLWHWPVLVLASVALYRPGPGFQLLLVAISLTLAVVAYHAVEKPVRENQTLIAKPRIAALAFALLMVIGGLAADGWKTAASDESSLALARAKNGERNIPAP